MFGRYLGASSILFEYVVRRPEIEFNLQSFAH